MTDQVGCTHSAVGRLDGRVVGGKYWCKGVATFTHLHVLDEAIFRGTLGAA